MTAFLAELITLPQWILWRGQPITRAGVERLNKIPIDPRTLRKASSTDPHTWNTYPYCIEALPAALEEWQAEDADGYRGGGLGFVFTAEDPYCGIDLDHVREATTGAMSLWAHQLVRVFNTYVEVSPSSTGLHLLGLGRVGEGRKRGPIEVYDRARFFTMTGAHLDGSPPTLAAIEEPLAWLLTSMESLAKALARDGDRFSHLVAGQWQRTYPSQSEADLAFCTMAVRCGATAEQCDALMRLSGLMRPKWDERHGAQTYGAMTIARALESQARGGGKARRRQGEEAEELCPMPEQAPWPVLDEAAYYGIAGDIVCTIEPHTEGDPVAVLVQFLVMVGNALHRTAYFPIEADFHHVNLHAGIVGKTARGRKGTAAGYPRRLMLAVDPHWRQPTGGLSSGEGVIWNVRDPIGEEGEKNYDPGIEDKRLCILQTEFAGALKKMSQEGNILSQVLRDAWDGLPLGSLTSGRVHSPVKATEAHISVIAHITLAELQRLLTETDAASGFANRFLWVCAQRSKLLPDGGGYPDEALRPLTARLRQTLAQARSIGRMQRSAAAQALWRELYPALTEELPGLLGAITARAEAQTLRLSMLYALLDGTDTITPDHTRAAHALWRYCDDSARYIFGDVLGDPVADELLRMLRSAGHDGMTRTALYQAFAHHVKSTTISVTLSRLHREGLVAPRQEQTTGRPRELWYYAQKAQKAQ